MIICLLILDKQTNKLNENVATHTHGAIRSPMEGYI